MTVRIGITCDSETITDRRGQPSPRYVMAESYVEAVRRAGGQPWLLPQLDAREADSLLDVLHGLVISGGDFDVPPAYYGEAARPVLGKVNERRSAFERALLERALAREIPVLGVCGGMQLLNVVLGGTLYQDVSERPGTAGHSQPHDKSQPHHPVSVSQGSLLARLTGKNSLEVNSTHHQVVSVVAPRLRSSGVAPDGVVEAVESPSERFVLGVQWHPEAMRGDEQLAIYRGLVGAASQGA